MKRIPADIPFWKMLQFLQLRLANEMPKKPAATSVVARQLIRPPDQCGERSLQVASSFDPSFYSQLPWPADARGN
jgi:hypothetical protein